MLAVSVLTACLTVAGFTTYPSAALAAQGRTVAAVQHVVTFESNGATLQHATGASTVGAFLKERGIVAGPNDYVQPSLDTPVSDRLIVTYRAAVPVTIVTARSTTRLVSSADDVGALLEEQGVVLGANDEVRPTLAARLAPNQTVRIVRVANWTRTVEQPIAAKTVHRISLAMAPGKTKVLSAGTPGMRETMVRFTQRDGGSIAKSVLGSHVVRSARPRVIAEGVGEYEAFVRFEGRGLDKTAYVARAALTMVATAYTANCYGCSGITASGRPAGHGIVAVDPRVIRLGSRLYIPGYGFAIAGDTGGAIRGNRIDLGFNSIGDALRFGRRPVTVYQLK